MPPRDDATPSGFSLSLPGHGCEALRFQLPLARGCRDRARVAVTRPPRSANAAIYAKSSFAHAASTTQQGDGRVRGRVGARPTWRPAERSTDASDARWALDRKSRERPRSACVARTWLRNRSGAPWSIGGKNVVRPRLP
jgi:hypothetical protein